MVSDAQRNVIISLKLAADPQNEAIADQVKRQAESVSAAGVVAGKKAVEVYQRVEAGKTHIKVTESNKRTSKDLKEKEKAEKAAKKLAKQIVNAEKLRVESHQKANEAGVAAVQGLSDIVEGAAKLGLVSEDNFQKFAKQFVMIQSGIQVFKGATDVWWKGREALIALSTATTAQTTANNLMAVSADRAAGAQAVSGTVGRGTVLGGAAIAGKAAAVAVALGAVALGLHDGFKYLLGKVVDLGEDSGMMHDAFLGWYEATQDLAESQKRLAKSEQFQQALERDRTGYEETVTSRIDLQGQLRGASNRVGEATAFAGGETDIQSADRVRLEAVREVAAAEREMQEHSDLMEERTSRNRFTSGKMAVKVLKDREEAQGRLLAADKNRLTVIRAQNSATIDQLNSEREKLVVLQEAKRVEAKGLEAKLGSLNPGLQKHAVAVAEKVKSGQKLNRRDVAIMQEAGVGQKQIDDFHAEQGRSVAGSDTFTEVFGTKNREIKETEGNIDDMRSEAISGKRKESAAEQQVESSASLFKKYNEARVKQDAELKGVLLETINGLSQKNTVQQIQQASADAADAINQQNMATLNAIKTMQDGMVNSLGDMQKQFDQFQLFQNSYKQA